MENLIKGANTPATPPLRYITGFESTYMFGTGHDILDTTHHTQMYAQDFYLVRHVLGITEIRYPIPWHKIERVQGAYDWSWMDKVMEALQFFGITIIADPWHHTSHPDWLKGGLTNPDAAKYYMKFVLAFAKRYPYVRKYTIFNEPFATTWLAAHEGIWYPYVAKGPRVFIDEGALNVCYIQSIVGQALRDQVPGVEIVYVDTCEYHHSWKTDHQNELNERRFVMLDIVLGRGPENLYLQKFGFDRKKMRWFDKQQNQLQIDVLGLDYYCHSEYNYLPRRAVRPSNDPLGFAKVAYQYYLRYRSERFRWMLTETNFRGTIEPRITWLKWMRSEVEVLAAMGMHLEAFCWFPAIDSTGWGQHYASKLCVRRDHTGLGWLDPDKIGRYESELTEAYARLVKGEDWRNLRHYEFRRGQAKEMRGFDRLMHERFGDENWHRPAPVKPFRHNRRKN